MIKICEHCGDTALENDACPVCSQQVRYTLGGRSFPLAISRGRMVTANAPGMVFRMKRCAVVAESNRYPYGEYLTACGEVTSTSHSVSNKRPDCPDCKKALRARVAYL